MLDGTRLGEIIYGKWYILIALKYLDTVGSLTPTVQSSSTKTLCDAHSVMSDMEFFFTTCASELCLCVIVII
jgi:hypothetical protein